MEQSTYGICYGPHGGGRPLTEECRIYAEKQGWKVESVPALLGGGWNLTRHGEVEVFKRIEELWQSMGRPMNA